MNAPTPDPWSTPTGPTRAEQPDPSPTSPDLPTTPQLARPDGAPFPASLTRRYRVSHELGRGGMGVVYLAHDAVLGRDVALKLLRGGDAIPAEQLARFQREAHTAGSLDHPNIIKVHDFGQAEGQHYLTMYLARGGSLAQHRDRYRDPPAAAELMRKVALAVEHAHSHGVLHRDLKPHNILLGPGDEPLVADFGLAKFLDNPTHLTQSFIIPGTPAYMAPEQASGQVEKVGVAADVWALGVILFELLTGQLPFQGRNREEMLHRILTAEIPRPRSLAPNLDPTLEAIVLKCLRRELGQRCPSAGSLADELTRWLRTQSVSTPTKRVSRRAVMAGLAIAGVGGLAAWLLPRYFKDTNPPPEGGGDPENGKLPPPQWTLLDATGPKETAEFLVGKDDAKIGKHPGDGAFQLAVNPTRPALLRLCSTPPQEWPVYRIEAEIRHDTPALGAVGLFFAHQFYDAAGVAQHCYARVGYTDSPGKLLDLRMHRLVGGTITAEKSSQTHRLEGFPEPRNYRKLGVVIGESEVLLELDGREVARTELRHIGHYVLDGVKAIFHPWSSRASGGIGLWAFGTDLSCRSFSIQPAM